MPNKYHVLEPLNMPRIPDYKRWLNWYHISRMFHQKVFLQEEIKKRILVGYINSVLGKTIIEMSCIAINPPTPQPESICINLLTLPFVDIDKYFIYNVNTRLRELQGKEFKKDFDWLLQLYRKEGWKVDYHIGGDINPREFGIVFFIAENQMKVITPKNFSPISENREIIDFLKSLEKDSEVNSRSEILDI